MGAKGKLHGDIDAPAGYIGELVATSLRANGWQSLSYNDLTQEITAEQKKTEKRSGMSWPFEYRLSARWNGDGDKFKIFIEVYDREQHSIQKDCELLCRDVLKGVEKRAVTLADVLKKAAPRTTYGMARWANDEDISKAGYCTEAVEGNGLLAGPLADGKRLVIGQEDAIRHAVVCGPTGCGKSSSVFIPNLIERSHVSAIVTEATAGAEPPDLYFKTAGYRASKGSKIFYFNPDDLSSTRVNPVDQVQTVAQAQDIADLIMRNTSIRKSTSDPYWENSERHLLSSLLMHVSAEKGDLAAIRRHVREGAQALEGILAYSKVPAARDEYKGFLRNSTENSRNGVLSGLMQRLNLWVNPRIVALTEKTDFDPAELVNEHFTFYLAVPAQKESLKPAAALVFNFLLGLLLEHKHGFQIPVALFLDEFTNFGVIPGMAKNMSIIRHKSIPIMLGMQDYVQVRSVYGEDEATVLFGQPSTKFIFRTTDLPTAKRVSESLGQETVVDRKLSTSCQVTEREFGKPLLSPSEVMALDPQESILFTPSTPPLKLKRFSWRDYVEQMKVQPEPRRELVIDERLVAKLEKQAMPATWEGSQTEEPPGEPPAEFDIKEESLPAVDLPNQEIEAEQEIKAEIEDNVQKQENLDKPERQRVSRVYDDDDDETLPI